jgi:hypothetical protein
MWANRTCGDEGRWGSCCTLADPNYVILLENNKKNMLSSYIKAMVEQRTRGCLVLNNCTYHFKSGVFQFGDEIDH